MRVLIDGVAARQGGLATYVRSLAGAWSVAFNDEVTLLASTDLVIRDDGRLVVRRVPLRGPRMVSQPLAQTRALQQAVRELRPDVVLASVPQVALTPLGVPEVVVIHDMRHHDLPAQFGPVQRVQRALSYRLAYRRARSLIVPSCRTEADVRRLLHPPPDRPIAVIPHGADHVPERQSPRRGTTALAFGHTPNKRATTLVEAWARLVDFRGDVPLLQVAGCSARMAEELSTIAEALGMGRWVRPLPYLPEGDFDAIRGDASLVVFPSDYEGFGLPVLEAMRTGVPVVITPDRALLEVAGGHAVVAEAWTPEGLSRAVDRALSVSDESVAVAQAYASRFTWRETVRQTREVLAAAAR